MYCTLYTPLGAQRPCHKSCKFIEYNYVIHSPSV